MGKSIKANDDNHTDRKPMRNNVAYGMICARTGISQTFADKRSKRSKDRKNSWQRDSEDNDNG